MLSLLTIPLLLVSTQVINAQTTTTGSSTTSATTSTSTPTSYNVDVGNGGLVFSPEVLTVPEGSTINFYFYPRNHSIVESSFDNPCVPTEEDTIYSGFFPVMNGTSENVFTMTVNTTDPIWLYCSQGMHCQSGMAMVINPPMAGDEDEDEEDGASGTLDAYKVAASGVAMAENPDGGVFGGVVLPLSQVNGTTTGSAASSASSALSSAASSASAAATSATGTGAAVSLRPIYGEVVAVLLAAGALAML